MSESKHTPGPWVLDWDMKWPFKLRIKSPNWREGEDLFSFDRYCWSSRQRSLADLLDAVGFDEDERPEIRRVLAEQEANARLIAAAPAMHNALTGMIGLTQLLLARDDLPPQVRAALGEIPGESHRVEAARAALSLAEGKEAAQ
jgi:hypothetical protein